MTKSLKLTCAGIAAASALALPATLLAGTDTAGKSVIEETKKSCITGDLGVNFVSKYYSRGALQEDQGAIGQPYADLYFSLYEGAGFIDKVTLNLGIWGSIHSHHPGNVSTTSGWYEFDYTPGVSVTFAKNFTLTASYTEFDSPNDSFVTSRNLNFNLAFNDADYLGAFALHPHVAYLHEMSGKAANGPLGTRGNYYEAGIAPALPTFGPLSVTFPVTAGFGSHSFYASNDSFGYASAGANASVALTFVPACYGAWALNAGATYYYLHGSLADTNAGSGFVPGDSGRHNDFVFSGGIGATF
ncbi:MAG: hypothetical protein WCP06_04350 [Verrucomicrobiota bacterium]